MNVTGIYETHLPVDELERSVEFYRNVVGLKYAWGNADRGLAFLWTGDKQKGMLGLW